MARWRGAGQLDDALETTGDSTFFGMDMKSADPASMKSGFYREGYNVRVENGGLETRKGMLCPGALNIINYNQIYGVGLFSNPNGLEWLAIATVSGVWFVRDGEYPRFVPLPEKIQDNVEFSQCFDQFFIWRGPALVPLVWGGDWAVYWQTFPPPTGGRSSVPNAYSAENAANRMLVPYGKDRVAVSDIADYTEYDWTIDDFQINQGESDDLVRIFPWQQQMVMCFKRRSIYRVSNVAGDLSGAVLERLPGTIGLVGRHAVVQVSGDIYFMSHSGVFTISQVFVNTPQPADLPISDYIKPVIDSINWNAANLIYAAYRRDRVFFAVPLKNCLRNNCVLVYNIATGFWESIDTFGDPDFRVDDMVTMDYNGERRLFAVDRVKGLIVLMEQGKTDILGDSTTFEYPIDFSVMTRGYTGVPLTYLTPPGKPRNSFQTMQIDIATWNPQITVVAYPDGGKGKTLMDNKTFDRTKYRSFGKPLWNPLNANDDHASPRRQDYSVQLPFILGYNGIQVERNQETTQRYPVTMMGRYLQYKISNATGYMNLRGVTIDSDEDQREPRPRT